MIIDAQAKSRLLQRGVSTLHGAPFSLPDNCDFEPPCSIKWMSAEYYLYLGAFSYAVSGYYFGTKIGRYTSIGESVQVGRGSHPVSWASTSPVFYTRHEDVVDFTIGEAANFSFSAPHRAPRLTIIGNDVYIGHGALIMQGIQIGNGAVIGAHAVVTKDVPDFAVVAGNPAVVKKYRFPEAVIERMQRVAWWRFAFWDLQGAPVDNPQGFLDFVEARITAGIEEFNPEMVKLSDVVNSEQPPRA